MTKLYSRWHQDWQRPSFRRSLTATVPLLILALIALTRFLNWVEARPGVRYADPILALYTPIDCTWIAFLLIYTGILIGIGFLAWNPDELLLALQTYVIMVAFRIIAMFLLPLEPPALLIPLQDPFVQYLGTGKLLTKDLFFSGHTSTLFLLFLTARGARLKAIFLVCTAGVAISVLVQHVHYTVDVFVAPFFAYAAYRVALSIDRRFLGTGRQAA
jgi:hypothetical protein